MTADALRSSEYAVSASERDPNGPEAKRRLERLSGALVRLSEELAAERRRSTALRTEAKRARAELKRLRGASR